MLDLGLTYSQRVAYQAALRNSHAMKVAVHVLDQNEKPQASLTAPASLILEGQVTVDTSQDITRSLSLTLVDPAGRFLLDPASPKPHAIYPSSMLYVVRSDYVPSLARWVDCPVFWGPTTFFKRTGSIVELQAVGKEMLGLNPRQLWTTKLYRKGTKVTDVIRNLLGEQGEQRFHLPTMKDRIGKKLSLSPHQEAWAVAKSIAQAHNRQLFYDARGRACMRPHPTHAAMSFYAVARKGKPEPVVLPSPDISLDFFKDTRNVAEILGPEPAPHHYRIRAVSYPHRSAPLSPWSQQRNGQPAWMVETIENDKLKRAKQARDLGDYQIRHTALLSEDVNFDILPVPHLQEEDLVYLVTRNEQILVRMSQFTIPLRASGTMNIGSSKRVGLRRLK